MEVPDPPIDLLVKAVLDGAPVDWDSAESSASSRHERARIRQFRTLAAIATLHRESGSASTGPVGKADVWGPLRLLERIGRGSFGEVYRAWDTRLDREVALKILRHREGDPDWTELRALEEGRLLARVRHPNIATVFGADRIGDRVGIWMEFVRGRTLEQILRTHGALGVREATAIGLDLCLALSAVHRAGLIHGDIKAQNVMREDGGRIVLMDFGAGRVVVDEGPAELSGTPLYLAPELFAGAPATPRTDIYSLGVLLYHLVTGDYPVKGATVAELRAAHDQRRRSWLRDERPDLSERFVQAVECALELDPHRRFESAGAMGAMLSRVAATSDLTVAAHTLELVRAVKVHASPSRHRIGTRFYAIVASIAAAAIVVAVVSSRHGLLGWPDGAIPARTASSDRIAAAEVVRTVTMPPARLVGGPSADARLFSFEDSTGNVAVVDLATGDVRRLTRDAILEGPGQNAEFSAMSADGRFVAYSWFALDGKVELRVVDVEGKHPRVLLRSDAIDYPVPIEWSRDGAGILASLTRPDHTKLLAIVSTDNGSVQPVKELGWIGAQHASLSRDSRFVVYDAPQQPSATARDIFIIRSDGTNEHPLVEHPANDASAVWTPDGRAVLFASDRSGTMDLWSVAVVDGIPQGDAKLIHRNIGNMWVRGLTDTGSYFYYAMVGEVDAYAAEIAGDKVTKVAKVPTSYVGSSISSVWSPDGRRIAYASRRGVIGFDRGSTTLAVRDVSTGDQRELVPALNSFLLWSWSPDGHQILAQGRDARGQTGNYLIDPETGRTTALVVDALASQEGSRAAGGTFMPDGRLLYYFGPKHALLVHDMQTAAEETVFDFRAEQLETPDGKYKMSPDGTTLALTARRGQVDGSPTMVIVKPAGGGTWRELVRANAGEMVSFQDWMPDGQSVLFTRGMDRPGAVRSLWRVSIGGGDPQALGVSMAGLRDVSVNGDGTRVTFTAGWPKNVLCVLDNLVRGQVQ